MAEGASPFVLAAKINESVLISDYRSKRTMTFGQAMMHKIKLFRRFLLLRSACHYLSIQELGTVCTPSLCLRRMIHASCGGRPSF